MNNGDKIIIRTEVTNCGKYGSLENPGMSFGTSHGAIRKTTAAVTVIKEKKTVNIEFENDLPSSEPRPNRSIKYGRRMEADTSEPTEAKSKSGMRKAA